MSYWLHRNVKAILYTYFFYGSLWGGEGETKAHIVLVPLARFTNYNEYSSKCSAISLCIFLILCINFTVLIVQMLCVCICMHARPLCPLISTRKPMTLWLQLSFCIIYLHQWKIAFFCLAKRFISFKTNSYRLKKSAKNLRISKFAFFSRSHHSLQSIKSKEVIRFCIICAVDGNNKIINAILHIFPSLLQLICSVILVWFNTYCIA